MDHFSFDLVLKEQEIETCEILINYFMFFKNKPKLFFKKKKKILTKAFIKSSVWFTKNSNLEKLFVVGYQMFLSPGIVLKFLDTPYKFLRNKIKTWYGFIEAFYRLFPEGAVIVLKNLFGKKYKLLIKFFKKKSKKTWIFIKLFYLNFIFIRKKKKRIKKWVSKKYFRFE